MNLHTRTHPRTLSLIVRTIHHSASSAPASALSTKQPAKQPPSTPAGQQRNGVRSSLFRSSLCSVQFNSIQFSSVPFRFSAHGAASSDVDDSNLTNFVPVCTTPLATVAPTPPFTSHLPSPACAAPSVFIALLCAQFVVKICCQKEKYIS